MRTYSVMMTGGMYDKVADAAATHNVSTADLLAACIRVGLLALEYEDADNGPVIISDDVEATPITVLKRAS